MPVEDVANPVVYFLSGFLQVLGITFLRCVKINTVGASVTITGAGQLIDFGTILQRGDLSPWVFATVSKEDVCRRDIFAAVNVLGA